MSLTIRISQESKTHYVPGDWIGGVVCYTTAKTDEDLGSLGISFAGTTTAHMTSNNTDMVTSSSVHKASKGCLFRQYVSLHRTKKLQGSGTFAWPFVFRIPDTAAYKEGYNADSEEVTSSPGTPWKGENDAEAHPLPPSFCYRSGFLCSVQYQLCVKLIRLPCSILQGQSNLSALREIRIRPVICSSSRDLESLRQAKRKFFCNFEISHKTMFQALTMKARQLGHFATSHPCCQTGSLHLRMSLPRVIETNSEAPITPSIKLSCLGCEHVAQIATVRVKSFTLDLVSVTKVRAGNNCATQVQNLNLCRSTFTLPVSINDGPGTESDRRRQSVEVMEGLGEVAREALRKSRAVSEFATFNIFRAYTLKFKISIEFAGKTLSFQQQNIPVQVVDYAGDVGNPTGQPCQPPDYIVATALPAEGVTGLHIQDVLLDDPNGSCPPQYTT